MAWIEKRGDAYRLIFRVGGRKFTRSLKTTSQRAAEASLARVEDNLRRVELGLLELPEDVDVATFLMSDGRAEKRPTISAVQTIKQLFDAYFGSIPQGALEKSTLEGMHWHVKRLYGFFGPTRSLKEIQLPDLQAYIEARSRDSGLRGRFLSPATSKKEIVTLRTAWNWGRHAGLIDRAFPSRGLRYPKHIEKPPFLTIGEVERRLARGSLTDKQQADLWDSAFLTVPEIEQLLAHVRDQARDDFVYPMFVFAAHTGARRSEIARTQIDDLDFDSLSVVIHERKRVRGTHSTRRVPISPLLVEVLKAWLAVHPGGSNLFTVTRAIQGPKYLYPVGGMLDADFCHRLFKSAVRGSRWAKLRGWHVFRHSFCSNCAAKGIDQRVINAWVGHQTEEMVKRYRHLIPNQQQEAIRLVFAS